MAEICQIHKKLGSNGERLSLDPSPNSHRTTYFIGLIAGFTVMGMILSFLSWSDTKDSGIALSSLSAALDGSRRALYSHYEDPTTITLEVVDYGGKEHLQLYRCGPKPSNFNTDLTELVLLRGAMHGKEQWVTSGILEMLCGLNKEAGRPLSVSALDLPVTTNGEGLAMAFDALSRGLLSGRPATFITPASSGIAVVNLAEKGGDSDYADLRRIIKAWVPIATKYINHVPLEALQQFKIAQIPVLSVTGDHDDVLGQHSGELLMAQANAKRVELEGGVRVHLDKPYDFVFEVLKFLDENNL
eukprot:CAMPEP_0183767124 /NCGR_PEP_ID=MMETSP0739-20130205/12000_1 /TAXON_ID=385413 /ORGANISM="Thalassiosira miniscula, Strain CCMP1093" /LENGTH=300 /DNA_ID=CAMNT_0026005999 /DNA_START=1 /DNA_END=903 /DNA_ORIENTATION=+